MTKTFTGTDITTYTITTITIEQLEAMIVSNRGDLIDEDVCGRTFTGFTLIETGSMAGSYRGSADGDDVIFYPDEIVKVEKENTKE